jgi:hypothetical protein
MTSGDQYRVRAAELHARAINDSNSQQRLQFETLAQSYLRLAEQADRNQQLDISYETPPAIEGEPDVKS